MRPSWEGPLLRSMADRDSGDAPAIAVLVALTSRGSNAQECRKRLHSLGQSLSLSGCKVEVYAGIDSGDAFYDGTEELALLAGANVLVRSSIKYDLPPGSVCAIWRGLAKTAFEESQAVLFVFLGDDVTIHTDQWGIALWSTFQRVAAHTGAPLGFACVAMEDESFVGFPTFPVLHRLHLEIFEGAMFPEAFINQVTGLSNFEIVLFIPHHML
jgi:hypothetical protein